MAEENLKLPSLRALIPRIGELPSTPPFLLETTGEKWIFENYRNCNKILELWLRNILLYQPLDPRCLEGKAIFYKPVADFSVALLDLCQEIHYIAPDKVGHPAEAWFEAMTGKLNAVIEITGLIGNTQLVGKRELFNSANQWIDYFENCEVDFILEPAGERRILYVAQEIAKKDDSFNKKAWKPYLRKWRKYNRILKECKRLQFCYLDSSGQLIVTGEKKKLPSQTSKKVKNRE